MLESAMWALYQVLGVLFVGVIAILAIIVVLAGTILTGYALMSLANMLIFAIGVLIFWIADAFRWVREKARPKQA